MRADRRAPLQAGVTPVELAVAVVVIAILVAIGIPTYRHHVLRVKSADGSRELLTVALRLQGCHKRTGSFVRMDDVPNDCVKLPYVIAEGTYRISGDIGGDAFMLTATPVGSQAADARCGAFTLDHLGQQNVTGTSSADPKGCWGDRRN